jgi:hypothetical protein
VTACRGCNTLKGHRKLAEFLSAEPVARKHFFALATAVWPRHLRAVFEQLERADARRAQRRAVDR